MGKIETFILDLLHGLIECLPINASTVLRRHAILTVPLQRVSDLLFYVGPPSAEAPSVFTPDRMIAIDGPPLTSLPSLTDVR